MIIEAFLIGTMVANSIGMGATRYYNKKHNKAQKVYVTQVEKEIRSLRDQLKKKKS